MSTKVSMRWRERTAELPGYHLYADVLDDFTSDGVVEPPVYLRLDGVDVELHTLPGGGASVKLTLPRELARELGLLAFMQVPDGAAETRE